MNGDWSIRAYQPCDLGEVGAFLAEVFRGLGREFELEGKESDIRDLDAVYPGNRGCFLIAERGGKMVGTVGVRRFSDEIAELKRLYLAEAVRGLGIGEALCRQAIADAARLGYRFLRLDTTARATAALPLFGKLGFQPIPRYNEDTYAEIFMEKELYPAA